MIAAKIGLQVRVISTKQIGIIDRIAVCSCCISVRVKDSLGGTWFDRSEVEEYTHNQTDWWEREQYALKLL